MTFSSQAQFQNLTIVPSTSITSSYISAVTTSNPTVLLAVKNGTNSDVSISFDGKNPKLGFPPTSESTYDLSSDAPSGNNLLLSSNTTIFVRWEGIPPAITTGNFYIELIQVVST